MQRRSFLGAALAGASAATFSKVSLASSITKALDTTVKASTDFSPSISGLPAIPAINWSAIGATAPALLTTTSTLPTADVVVICWAESEWAAIEHVFVSSSSSMSYSSSSTSSWSGWEKYSKNMPSVPSSDDWTYWGYYRLVSVNGTRVLLFKSNTHLDWPGQTYLADLIQLLITDVKPSLIMSTGTAGGSRLTDHLGTVNVVNAATMYSSSGSPSSWPTYTSTFSPVWSIVQNSKFSSLLFPIPATSSNLQTLASQFNSSYGTSYTLSSLDADSLCLPTALPALNNLTTSGVSLLTASTFVTANTSGDYANYAVIEMDDAVIAQTCQQNKVQFCAVRNVSDPAQNASLPSSVQGNWGSAVYDVFGFYTSYNGALVAWAIIAGMAA
jgi:nucleoside phosphorylase